MSGHLCLKWNNHSSAFLKNITKIQIKERFADATIICGGKYFAVHRIVLSTCSDYFDEVFDRIQCQHPYIVFKDIDSKDMELLLNYMYHGEVTVTQGCLPALIKAAEVLRVKGLAVPDDDIHSGEMIPEKKKKIEEHKRRKTDLSEDAKQSTDHAEVQIKEEPQDNSQLEENDLSNAMVSLSNGSEVKNEGTDDYPMNSLDPGNSHLKKTDETVIAEPLFEEQSSSWGSFATSDALTPHPPNPYTSEDDIRFGPVDITSRITPVDVCESTKLTKKLSGKGTQLMTRRFPCTFCSLKFVQKNDLRRHIRCHTGDKPFRCFKCLRKFSQGAHLKAHLLRKTPCCPPTLPTNQPLTEK